MLGICRAFGQNKVEPDKKISQNVQANALEQVARMADMGTLLCQTDSTTLPPNVEGNKVKI